MGKATALTFYHVVGALVLALDASADDRMDCVAEEEGKVGKATAQNLYQVKGALGDTVVGAKCRD